MSSLQVRWVPNIVRLSVLWVGHTQRAKTLVDRLNGQSSNTNRIQHINHVVSKKHDDGSDSDSDAVVSDRVTVNAPTVSVTTESETDGIHHVKTINPTITVPSPSKLFKREGCISRNRVKVLSIPDFQQASQA
ncbi:hypothetical protein CCR75_002922 [Bremia lactucae]|uniref:Uncharacterized protein n=1 Tax=Bremia lactucae TaxID=4779 RepID=A0A976IFY1_BRELC|nr:hypothetical protein CCR75_002922 [Bremia lactucae]